MAPQIYKEISSHPEWGFRIVKLFDLSTTPLQFEEILKNSYVEEVFFCVPRAMTKKGFVIDSYLQICEEMGRTARVFMNIWPRPGWQHGNTTGSWTGPRSFIHGRFGPRPDAL
jgi:hypothetical protein